MRRCSNCSAGWRGLACSRSPPSPDDERGARNRRRHGQGTGGSVGVVAGDRADHARQRHALHADRPAWRHRGVLLGGAGDRHLGLLRGVSLRGTLYPGADPAGRTCAGVRRAGQFHLGGTDRLATAHRALGLDPAAHVDRLLHVRHLCDGGKLAERGGQQRDPWQGALGLHDGADPGHHRGPGPADAGRCRDFRAVHLRLHSRVGLLRPHPVVGGRGARGGSLAGHVIRSAVPGLAAGGHRHLSAR